MPWPTYLPHHRKSVGDHVLLHRPANIEQPVARPRLVDRQFQRFPVTSSSCFAARSNLAHRHRHRRIAVIPIQLHARIDRNDVALLQHPSSPTACRARSLVHRGTQHKRKFAARRRRVITLERRLRARVLHHLFRRHFQILGGDALLHHLREVLQDLPHQQPLRRIFSNSLRLLRIIISNDWLPRGWAHVEPRPGND